MKKIQVLPSLVTLGNLLSGFGAIYFCMKALYMPKNSETFLIVACWLIFIAMLFDVIDGRVARITDMVTEFGGQLDSLSDAISFGLAPAAIAATYLLPVEHFPQKIKWLVPACYLVCTILRLARFNVESISPDEDHSEFKGLPSPAGAGIIVSTFLCFISYKQIILSMYPRAEVFFSVYILILFILVGALEVSNLKYIHVGQLLFRDQKPFTFMVQIFFFAVLAALYITIMIMVGFYIYMSSGVISTVLHFFRKPDEIPESRQHI